MTRIFSFAIALVVGMAQPALAGDDPWAQYRFLIGEWVGQGSGDPGQGSGGFSVTADLQGKVLIRRNRADYPAGKGKPAFSHEDLMVIYREADGKAPEAIYFDSEGHVIRYHLSFSEDQKTLTFLSDVVPSAPRFRFSYAKQTGGQLGIRFEIAPPGKPEAFKKYIEATAHRKDKKSD